MRVAAYCPPRFRSLVEPAIGTPAAFHERWPDFERAVGGADCGVAVIEWLDESPGAVDLNALRADQPWTRVVVVTRMDGENALVAPNVADSIVWIRHARALLRKAVETPQGGLRSRMASFIRDSLVCSMQTKVALLEATNADPPIRTVAEWADRLATTVRTLERWFARDFASGITPKLLLDATVIVWARDRFPAASSWTGLGNHAEADPQMLRETAVRLIGASPSADATWLLREFRRGTRVSPEMVGPTSLAEGLAALLRSRW